MIMKFYLHQTDNDERKVRYEINARVVVEVKDMRDASVTMMPAVDVQPHHHLLIDGYEYTIDALEIDKKGM